MPPGGKVWDQNYDADWAARVAGWKWTATEDGWKTSGTCPRCDHAIDHEIPRGTQLAATAAVAETEEEVPVTVTVRCNCTEDHENRPEAFKTGCGPSVNLTIPLPR